MQNRKGQERIQARGRKQTRQNSRGCVGGHGLACACSCRARVCMLMSVSRVHALYSQSRFFVAGAAQEASPERPGEGLRTLMSVSRVHALYFREVRGSLAHAHVCLACACLVLSIKFSVAGAAQEASPERSCACAAETEEAGGFCVTGAAL